ncbi:MAG: hypothetical protein KGQ52_00745 [Alphaproteobacteria bacterium]|nr:hypothetical protein [Alphaproteobacteria bacterium]
MTLLPFRSLICLLLPLGFAAAPAAAATACLRSDSGATPVERDDGTTNLCTPRFVSIKSGSAMLRAGPGDRFPILWEYRRAGLPMEVLQEYEIWRKVRDPAGVVGWMQKALLTRQRTAIITGQTRLLYVSPDVKSRIAWRIAPGAVVMVTLCEDMWCRVSRDGRSGYILREHMWGTYRREKIEG